LEKSSSKLWAISVIFQNFQKMARANHRPLGVWPNLVTLLCTYVDVGKYFARSRRPVFHFRLSRPHYSGSNFALLTTFPNKELTDEAATLESAGLLNAAILMRLK
jgi:hypothetical protein